MDLGLAGLSDDSRIKLYNYTRKNVGTEWGGLLLRASLRSIELCKNAVSAPVHMVVEEMKVELKEWEEAIKLGMECFK